jgi:hypothetical protein
LAPFSVTWRQWLLHYFLACIAGVVGSEKQKWLGRLKNHKPQICGHQVGSKAVVGDPVKPTVELALT